jgi:hypothetical protein
MADNDHNRTNETKEPNRDDAPADRSGQTPVRGEHGERIGSTEQPKGSTREPSREH